MAATTMFSLDGATHHNPHSLLSYRSSLSLAGGAAVSLYHNLGQSQSSVYSTNFMIASVRPSRLGTRSERSIRYRLLNANTIEVRNRGATLLTVAVKVLALHSMVI